MHLKSDLKSGLTTFAINYSSDKIIIRNKIHPFETVLATTQQNTLKLLIHQQFGSQIFVADFLLHWQ